MDRSIKIKGFLFVMALLVVPTLGTTPRAQTSSPVFQCFLEPLNFFNDCTGEQFAGDILICFSTFVTVDQSGGQHFLFRVRGEATLVGLTTGQEYKGHLVANNPANINGNNDELTATFKQVVYLNTAGSQDNFTLIQFFRITINAKGEITSLIPDEGENDVEIICKG